MRGDSPPQYPRQADIGALLESLSEAGVEFIVVGGAAAVMHGAPITTLDLDIVPRRTEENIDRLEAALSSIGTLVRDPAGRRLEVPRHALTGAGQVLMKTNLGPLDCLGTLHDGRDFEDLMPHSELLTDGNATIRILNLPTLIAIKEEAGRAKDRLVLPILIALLEPDQDVATEPSLG